MRRIKLWIQYDGTDYAGWQVQENATGIQNVIEEALFVLTGERIRLTGAGRTDKGVHALGQVAHFDTNSRIPGDKWHYQLKPILPDAIRVIGSAETDLSFHARFSAQKKRYRYTIFTEAIRPPMYRHFTAHVNRLDTEATEDAIPLFLGKHDYRAFMSSGSPVPNTCRTLDKLTLTRNGALLHLDFEAESFLYNQVRIITGTLVAIGLGRMQPAQAKRALDEGIRRLAGPTMPPQGLTLMEVLYDGEEER